MAKPVFKSTKRKTAPFTVTFQEGEVIFREGDLGTDMYIVQEGSVEVYRNDGGSKQQLAVFEKGDFFGEMSVLEDLPRTATAAALTEAQVVQINGSTFDQMLRAKPEIAVRIMRKLSRRLRQTDERLKTALGSGASIPALEIGAPADETVLHAQLEGDVRPPQILRHPETGTEFSFGTGSETSVGRRDPVTGIEPDVDLTEVDTQRSTSRRHAKIKRRGELFFVSEEIGTMNGTFVNGERIETGKPAEITPGDEVQFGLVKMIFEER